MQKPAPDGLTTRIYEYICNKGLAALGEPGVAFCASDERVLEVVEIWAQLYILCVERDAPLRSSRVAWGEHCAATTKATRKENATFKECCCARIQ